MIDLLIIWLGLALVLTAFALRRPPTGSALTLSYFFGLSLIHVPGALPFLYGEFRLGDFENTRLGFEMTLTALATFVTGAIAARTFVRQVTISPRAATKVTAHAFEWLGWRAIGIGVVSYFILLPVSSLIPSATSVVSALATSLILGLWLVLYGAAQTGNRRSTLMVFAILPILPVSTLVFGGFLGYGVYWVLSVVAFFVVLLRQRLWVYLAAPAIIFLGLSLFVTYAGQRDALRELIWYERSSLFDRLVRASQLITDFEFLDLSNPTHVVALENRLNQNELVGAAISNHEAGVYDFAFGATLPFWALIPRFVWADKPTVGGGGSIVTDYTGIEFAHGTSIGAGQVLEFYINFGVPGVLLGFAGLGFLLTRLDQAMMQALASGNIRRLLLCAMPGLSLLEPGGNLLEIVVTAVSAVVVAYLLISFGIFNLARRRTDQLALVDVRSNA